VESVELGPESGEAAASEGPRHLVHWGRGLDRSIDEFYDLLCLLDSLLRLLKLLSSDDGYWKHAMVCGEALQSDCGRAGAGGADHDFAGAGLAKVKRFLNVLRSVTLTDDPDAESFCSALADLDDNLDFTLPPADRQSFPPRELA
jgi:hypothetical protein